MTFSNSGCTNDVSIAKAGYPPGGARMFESGCQGAADQKPPELVNSLPLLPNGCVKTKISSEDGLWLRVGWGGLGRSLLSEAAHSLFLPLRLSACLAGTQEGTGTSVPGSSPGSSLANWEMLDPPFTTLALLGLSFLSCDTRRGWIRCSLNFSQYTHPVTLSNINTSFKL